MIGAASTGIVHDIENPLSGILGFTRLLEVGLDGTDKIDYCLEIKKGVSRIRKMTAEILAIASGREDIPLEIGEVNLEKFFSGLVTQIPLNSDVALNLDYKESIAIDKAKFRRVIRMLLRMPMRLCKILSMAG